MKCRMLTTRISGFFIFQKSTSESFQDNCDGSWKVCSPDEMKHFSAIGYFYGKDLQNALNVPIGLINSNWGGTPGRSLDS